MRRIILAAAVGGLLITGLAGASLTARADGAFNITTVLPYGTDNYTRFFVADELVRVAVSGDGSTNLDLYVRGPHERIVSRDDGPSDDCVVSFRAPETGYYTIQVANRGGWSNTYGIGVDD